MVKIKSYSIELQWGYKNRDSYIKCKYCTGIEEVIF